MNKTIGFKLTGITLGLAIIALLTIQNKSTTLSASEKGNIVQKGNRTTNFAEKGNFPTPEKGNLPANEKGNTI